MSPTMDKNKRKSPYDPPPDTRREFQRIEKDITLAPLKVTDEATRPVDRINSYIDQRYNLFLTFSKNVHPQSEAARTSAVIQKRMIRMQERLDRVNAKFKEELVALEEEVEAFLDTFDEVDCWFLKGNILCAYALSSNEASVYERVY